MDELLNIQDFIHVIRGQRVMLDRDIAAFYGVEPKRLNEKVKRNPKRFAGDDIMFQLTQDEYDDLRLRSQFATIKKSFFLLLTCRMIAGFQDSLLITLTIQHFTP